MSLTLTILGCGSSGGVPRVGQGWDRCDPKEPRNRRRRCSVLVRRTGPGGTTSVLVDTTPDLREQLLDVGLDRLDAVLYTHEHADHTHGIDDLRPMVIHMRRRILVHADAYTSQLLMARFGYCFESPPESDYPPILSLHNLRAGEPVTVDGPGGPVTALPFRVRHGRTDALGFRFNNVAYSPDLNEVYDSSLSALAGLDCWIVDALRRAPHPTHFSLSEALAAVQAVRPKRAILTNLHSDLDYRTLERELPEGVVPAFDGMVVEIA